MDAIRHEKGSVWHEVALKALEIRQRRKALEKQEQDLLDELRDLSFDQPSRCGGIKYEPTVRRGAIDYDQIPGLKEVDLEDYRKEDVVIWKLSLELELD